MRCIAPDATRRLGVSTAVDLAFGVLFTVAFLGAQTALAVQEVQTGGVPHVMNGPTPRDGIEPLRLEELWSAGGEEDEMIFGLVTKVCADEEGNIYVLDAQLNVVHVYSPDGELLRTLFGEGEGPGEIRDARDMVLLPDGRVAALQEFPGKLVFVDRDGMPAGALPLYKQSPEVGGSPSLTCGFSGGGYIVLSGTWNVYGSEPGIQQRTNFLSRFSADGNEEIRYCESLTQYNFNDLVFDEKVHVPAFWMNAAVGPDGRVYVAPYQDRYEIHVHAPDGELERVIEREYTRWKRTDAERRRVRGMIESATNGMPFEVKISVEEYEPDIVYIQRGLRLRADGTLWVLTSRGLREQAPGIMVTFDVFDPNGVFVKQVAVACEGNSLWDGIFFADPDRVVVVKGFTDAVAAQFGRGARLSDEEPASGEMRVICYGVRR